jgi:hypothetical protein
MNHFECLWWLLLLLLLLGIVYIDVLGFGRHGSRVFYAVIF